MRNSSFVTQAATGGVQKKMSLTLPVTRIWESCNKTKNNLNYFNASLWCLKRFYEGLIENKDLITVLWK